MDVWGNSAFYGTLHFFYIDTSVISTLHVELQSEAPCMNVRLYDGTNESVAKLIANLDTTNGVFDASGRNDILYLRFAPNTMGKNSIYKIWCD